MNETTIGKRPRRMRSAAERANWVALFERSGQSVKSFCREHELTPSGLWAWRRKSRQQAAGLVELPRLVGRSAGSREVTESGAAVRISFPSGTRVEVMAGTEVQWRGAVLGALATGEL
ncbi:MAG: Transposase [Gammaproteobacteria bacterium]|nr:Transposase [Gammaproteobacteria bacterium]